MLIIFCYSSLKVNLKLNGFITRNLVHFDELISSLFYLCFVLIIKLKGPQTIDIFICRNGLLVKLCQNYSLHNVSTTLSKNSPIETVPIFWSCLSTHAESMRSCHLAYLFGSQHHNWTVFSAHKCMALIVGPVCVWVNTVCLSFLNNCTHSSTYWATYLLGVL